VKLLPVSPADRPEVERLLAGTPSFNPADRMVALELVDDVLAKGGQSDYRIVCGRVGESLAGYVCYGQIALTEAAWDLYWIVVDPAFQGGGVGRRLLEVAEAACRAEGGSLLFAETSSLPDYAPARAFYEATGFNLAAAIPDFYAPGNDKLIYGKKL